MAEHEKVMGICYPNKCYIEVPTKKEYNEKAAKVDEHEQRLANITKEVDGALSCASVTTSGNITSGGTITSTGKINANGGLAVTSLTASGTITATGIINANGGLALSGDLNTGKVNGATITSTKFNGGTINSSGDYSGRKGTFSGAVTANKFDQSAVHTISSGTPNTSLSGDALKSGCLLIFTLPNTITNYTGNVKIYNGHSNNQSIYVRKGSGNGIETVSITSKTTQTISFSNVDSLYVWTSYSVTAYLTIGVVSLS